MTGAQALPVRSNAARSAGGWGLLRASKWGQNPGGDTLSAVTAPEGLLPQGEKQG